MEPKNGHRAQFHTSASVRLAMHRYSLGLAGMADAYNLLIGCQQSKSNEYGVVIWRVGVNFLCVFVRRCMCTFYIEHKAYNKPLQWIELIALVTVLRTLGGSGRCPIENHNGRVRAKGWVWISIIITLKLGRRFDVI